ncbi:MAG: 1-deoxy-D-xylulose-5-phosphate reductoisomerase [Firmicutes bacterium HGW-Firmicutes-11]|jgi:1-deoxy-D-xylulose-5-phosphate reductoisomerase|nr:MAG: 1-deoxy-D-xylulose-5-phosphate reductoisomerase [Firmicutes bacterium HGW-Firmicutes-11]
MKRIAILGSTGSIGTQTLDIIKRNPESLSVAALSCGRNLDVLEQQILVHRPGIVCVETESDAGALQRRHKELTVLWGEDGLRQLAETAEYDLLLNALVGMRGLSPTMEAIESKKDIALANKETLVAGGGIVMDAAQVAGVNILPVDSEHSAIFQALQGNQGQPVRRILLTASGGPFFGYTSKELASVTREQALRHPNWVMGQKITIDSATMMNKGLEVIEAHWLFDLAQDKIEVVIHRESIIHSMVEFSDHSTIAQMGVPDMRVPISYALHYPNRVRNEVAPLDLVAIGKLTFAAPDLQAFRCLALAYEALRSGGTYPVALNAANEVLVEQFLAGRIGFTDIQNGIERILERHDPMYDPTLPDILEADRNTRKELA